MTFSLEAAVEGITWVREGLHLGAGEGLFQTTYLGPMFMKDDV